MHGSLQFIMDVLFQEEYKKKYVKRERERGEGRGRDGRGDQEQEETPVVYFSYLFFLYSGLHMLG